MAQFAATVEGEWIDPNNHMTFWAYGMLFDKSANTYFAQNEILGAQGSKQNELRMSDQHIKYCKECFEGDPLEISVQILGFGEKYIHIFQRMRNRNDGRLLAVEESVRTNLGGSLEQSFAEREEPFQAIALARIALLAKSIPGCRGLPRRALQSRHRRMGDLSAIHWIRRARGSLEIGRVINQS